MNNLQKDAMKYQAAKGFLDELKSYRDNLTSHELSTLKGQALAGDIQGAYKGLSKIKREKNLL